MKITIATGNDIQNIMEIVELCIKDLENQGSYQWNDYYPNLDHINESIQDKSMYTLKENNNPSNTQKCVWGAENSLKNQGFLEPRKF